MWCRDTFTQNLSSSIWWEKPTKSLWFESVKNLLQMFSNLSCDGVKYRNEKYNLCKQQNVSQQNRHFLQWRARKYRLA